MRVNFISQPQRFWFRNRQSIKNPRNTDGVWSSTPHAPISVMDFNIIFNILTMKYQALIILPCPAVRHLLMRFRTPEVIPLYPKV